MSPGFLPWTAGWIVELILDNRALRDDEIDKTKINWKLTLKNKENKIKHIQKNKQTHLKVFN